MATINKEVLLGLALVAGGIGLSTTNLPVGLTLVIPGIVVAALKVEE